MPTAIAASIALAPLDEAGLDQLRDAAQRADEFGERFPDSSVYRVLRARALMRSTKLAVKSHRLADAVELGNQVFKIESVESEREQLDRIQSETYRWLGTAYEALGDCELAESLLEKALSQVEQILEQQPADIRALQNRLQFRRSLADAYHRNGKKGDAADLLKHAMDDARLLETIEPNNFEIVSDGLDLRSQFAFLQIRENPIEAEAILVQVKARIEYAKVRFGPKPEILFQTARLTYLWYLYHLKKNRDAEAASQTLNQAIELARRVGSEYPKYEDIDSVLAIALTQRTNNLLDLGDLREANTVAAEVLAVRSRQLQRSPDSLDLKIKWFWARYSLVRTQLRLGAGTPAVDEMRNVLLDAQALRDQYEANCQTERISELIDTLEKALSDL